MAVIWGSAWARSNRWKVGLLAIIGWTSLYLGMPRFMRTRRFAMQKSSELAETSRFDPPSLWHQTSVLHAPNQLEAGEYGVRTASVAGILGGVPGSISAKAQGGLASADADRKIIRTSALELEVRSPADVAEKIRSMAEHLGGYLVNSQISGSQEAPSATITIRIPAARFEEARGEIKKLAARVELKKTDATDVTKEYVDRDARLRNLRAEEAQYLGIMKHASSVKDTLQVSEKLSEVRGQIEQQQAEFDALSKQVETVAINVSLRAEADTRAFGLHWRPLYQLKLAAHDGLDALGDYAATMASVILYLPTILLWLATIILGAAVLWRILRWAARVLFAIPRPTAVPTQAI